MILVFKTSKKEGTQISQRKVFMGGKGLLANLQEEILEKRTVGPEAEPKQEWIDVLMSLFQYLCSII